MSSNTNKVFKIGAIILGLAIFLVIYIIYYIATYFEFKRNLKES